MKTLTNPTLCSQWKLLIWVAFEGKGWGGAYFWPRKMSGRKKKRQIRSISILWIGVFLWCLFKYMIIPGLGSLLNITNWSFKFSERFHHRTTTFKVLLVINPQIPCLFLMSWRTNDVQYVQYLVQTVNRLRRYPWRSQLFALCAHLHFAKEYIKLLWRRIFRSFTNKRTRLWSSCHRFYIEYLIFFDAGQRVVWLAS